jgi:nucleotide-binding universal stress UspA family protein
MTLLTSAKQSWCQSKGGWLNIRSAPETQAETQVNDMRVLLAVDPSTGSQHVVDEVAARPWPTGTTICVLSVVDMGRWEGLPTLMEDAKRAANTLVKIATEKLDRPGHKIFSEVQLGYPKKSISEFAREWKADLVMVGSRGQGAVSRFFLGSVALAVLRSAPCSVEIVRPASTDSPPSSRAMKILLATDGSECSEIAARSVANRPWPAGSEIKIICVRELLVLENAITVSSPCPVYPESLLDEILEDARKRADKAIAQAYLVLISKGLKVCEGPGTPVGDARAILLDEARAWGADLIVLGSHGRHGFDRLILGSVSESIALYADCSVEIIRV